MKNTWPGGHRHAMTQDEHKAWNAKYYPGTAQVCDEWLKKTPPKETTRLRRR